MLWQEWMAERRSGGSNLNLSVCLRDTEVSVFGLSPEWALSGSDSPMELQWIHIKTQCLPLLQHIHWAGKSNTYFSISELDVFHCEHKKNGV